MLQRYKKGMNNQGIGCKKLINRLDWSSLREMARFDVLKLNCRYNCVCLYWNVYILLFISNLDKIYPLLYFYLSSTLPLPIFYFASTCPLLFLYCSSAAHLQTGRRLSVLKWRHDSKIPLGGKIVPILGMWCSQPGNVTFPPWEYIVGIRFSVCRDRMAW